MVGFQNVTRTRLRRPGSVSVYITALFFETGLSTVPVDFYRSVFRSLYDR